MLRGLIVFICLLNILYGQNKSHAQTLGKTDNPDKYLIARDNYKINVNYNVIKIYSLSNDTLNSKKTLYLFLESKFKNDSVKIWVNGKLETNRVCTTDESLGVAMSEELKSIDSIKTVSIQINNGPTAIIQINSKRFVMGISYIKNQLLTISFYNRLKQYE